MGSNPTGNIYFHFEFLSPSPFRTGQRSPCKRNKSYDHSPVVIVVLDPRYDESYKALYTGIYSRSIALTIFLNAWMNSMLDFFYGFRRVIKNEKQATNSKRKYILEG